ncbi:MAG: glycosyltransferase family 4 protein [Candidatus Aureabacteria bacterium]|nr:glycosyltransferase family 4 protein [Candidatus Auribacterota bacterium]
MKIILINKFLYPKGGDAICALTTGQLLRDKGHEVHFWGMNHPKNPEYPYKELFIDRLDLDSRHSVKKQFSIAGKLLYSMEAKRKIEKFIHIVGKPDMVHLHNFAHQISPSILDVFKKFNIPCVMTMHDYKIVCASYLLLSHGRICTRCSGGNYYQCLLQSCVKNSRIKSMLNTIEMYLHHKVLRNYDYIHTFISSSRFLLNTVETMGFKKRIVHIPNFIDLSRVTPCYDAKENSICYVGRLSYEKGVETLIKTFKCMEEEKKAQRHRGTEAQSEKNEKEFQDLKLKIIGTGPMEAALKAQIAGCQNISFLGYKTGDDLKNEIRNSMFCVIPSEWYENNPLSVLEAFALGKPVIGAGIGGIPELVKDNVTGLTFESGNAEDLQEKITTLVKNPEKIRQMGQNSRKYIEEEFNSEIYYQKLMKVYQAGLDRI